MELDAGAGSCCLGRLSVWKVDLPVVRDLAALISPMSRRSSTSSALAVKANSRHAAFRRWWWENGGGGWT